jgi:hypothetical protein
MCYTVECVLPLIIASQDHEYAGECVYERKNVTECCLTSEECCEYAAPHEVGICDKNCTCKYASTSRRCSTEEDCENRLSALICRANGPCFYPVCLGNGACDCFDGTGVDLDGDGVECPDDCNDQDATITTELVCVRDVDNDHYPACPPTSIGDDDDDDASCMVFCVEPNHTCPYGYTDVADSEWYGKDRSHRTDTGVPCAELPEIDEDLCDCCDLDKRAYPGSLYAANTPNNCGDADYDCDGVSTNISCCSAGMNDYYVDEGTRYLWYADTCLEPFATPGTCGGCTTLNESTYVLEPGYACADECTGDEITTVAPGMCPNACADECVCVDALTTPVLGQCAKVVDACVQVRPDLFADHEKCCVRAVF